MLPEKIKLPKSFESGDLLPPNMDYPYFDRVRHTGFLYEEDDFSFENCCFLAEAAFIAYNHPSYVKYAFHYAGFDSFRVFTGKKVAWCFASQCGNCLLLSFRGTEMRALRFVPGIIADLKISMVAEKSGGLVHSGFREVLDEIWEGKDLLYRYLCQQKSKNPSLRIFVTGHSLGGALSLITSARFPEVNCVYTYGCPRAGNREFTDSIKAHVYRIVNNNDVVTTLPPKKILVPVKGDEYCHRGELKFIDAKGKLKDKITNKFAPASVKEKEKFLSLGFEELLLHLGKTRSRDFIDHSPFYYAAKLWNAYVDLNSALQEKRNQPIQSP